MKRFKLKYNVLLVGRLGGSKKIRGKVDLFRTVKIYHYYPFFKLFPGHLARGRGSRDHTRGWSPDSPINSIRQ